MRYINHSRFQQRGWWKFRYDAKDINPGRQFGQEIDKFVDSIMFFPFTLVYGY
jgi:hypothetical protein